MTEIAVCVFFLGCSPESQKPAMESPAESGKAREQITAEESQKRTGTAPDPISNAALTAALQKFLFEAGQLTEKIRVARISQSELAEHYAAAKSAHEVLTLINSETYSDSGADPHFRTALEAWRLAIKCWSIQRKLSDGEYNQKESEDFLWSMYEFYGNEKFKERTEGIAKPERENALKEYLKLAAHLMSDGSEFFDKGKKVIQR